MTLQSSGLQFTIACEADRWTIYLAGELDRERHADVVDVAAALAHRRVVHVTIDLGQVTMIDSAGYQAVARAAALIESGGGVVRIVDRPATVCPRERDPAAARRATA